MSINITLPLIVTLPLFFLAYRYYARYIAKVFGEDDKNPTPAVSINDQRDYVPTKPLVLFSHHFAAIAGAGPIIGPTIALVYGYIPVILWIVLGTIFIGAVHDFSALFASVRESGKSMAEVAERSMGKAGFIIFIVFAIFMLLLVGSAFIGLAAVAFTSLVPIKEMGILHSNALIKTVTIDEIPMANLGGIAATSLIFIICFSPLIGYLLYRKAISTFWVSLIAIMIALFSIRIGIAYPISLEHSTWMILLALYTFIAAGVPIWIIHQPRDFIDSFILYGGIIALMVGALTAGLKGFNFTAPAFNISQGTMKIGAIWPILFITVACGAVSGFHALVSGGTSSKQIAKESHTKIVGYGGMLLEGLFALGVVIAVGSGLEFDRFIQVVFPTLPGVRSNPVLAFALGVGGLLKKGISLPMV
jgi:carbon starvation protein